MNSLENLSNSILAVKFDNLDSRVTNAVKRAFIDTLGVTIAGINEEASAILTQYARENQGKPLCTVIGGGFKTSAFDASLVNGTILHGLDFDDTGAYTQGHPSAPIFPAILAIAEENRNTGCEIIEAYTIGVEVLSRLARSMPMMHLKGWHPTSVLGTIAAAAAAAKLLKLDVEKTKYSLSIAGSQACGLIKNFGTMTKPFHIGKAASNGVLSAKLAHKGFTAAKDLFDNDFSFPFAFSYKDTEKVNDILSGINENYAIIEPGINIKRYPACSLTHRAIDALLHIVLSNNIESSDVLSIECRVPPRAQKVLFHNNPKTGLEGKFSMQFVLACALKYKSVTLHHFRNEIVNNDEVQCLMKKITFGVHLDWKDGDDSRADMITVSLKDGSTLTYGVEIPSGNVKKPLTDEEVVNKYYKCTMNYLTPRNTAKSLEILDNLEFTDSIEELMSIIGTINEH